MTNLLVIEAVCAYYHSERERREELERVRQSNADLLQRRLAGQA